MSEEVKEVKQEGEFKVKHTMPKYKDMGAIPEITKVDLTKKPTEDAIQIGETEAVADDKQAGDIQKVEEQVREQSGEVTKVDLQEEKVESPLELVEDEDNNSEEITMVGGTESPDTSQEQEKVLPQTEASNVPENLEKLVSFMEETGGTIDDYARLNADYSDVDGEALLKEYYKQAKPHLDSEEIQFVIEDSFNYDEDLDEARDIRKKKLAYKEEVAKAKSYLDELKGKYYQEIKLRPGATQEQQKAVDFFNRYNEEQNTAKEQHEQFKSNTKELFNNDFKGFDFNVGEKKFRYKVQNTDQVADNQSNINNIIGKFLNDKGEVVDTKGYHKAMYAASNVDKIVNHFYEQGKVDAVKNVIDKSKNVSTEPRATADGNVFINGLKVRAISGLDSSKLTIKKKRFN